jgi:hypothetical protein
MAEPSLTIPEFCAIEKLSRSGFYQMDHRGEGPDTYYMGAARRITPEAHQRWRREREAAAKKAAGKQVAVEAIEQSAAGAA